MKKMKALQIIAAAMAVTVAATSAPVNVFAYGETSASSTLFTDTQNISDYATWKDNVWNKKDDQEILPEKVNPMIHQELS